MFFVWSRFAFLGSQRPDVYIFAICTNPGGIAYETILALGKWINTLLLRQIHQQRVSAASKISKAEPGNDLSP